MSADFQDNAERRVTSVATDNQVTAAPADYVPAIDERPLPLPEALAWFGPVVGQITVGYIYLLGGAPGSAKSKLVAQMGVEYARQGNKVGYLLAEESEARLRARDDARRQLGRRGLHGAGPDSR